MYMFTFRRLTEEDANELIRMKEDEDYSCFDLDHHITDLDNLMNNEEFDFFVGLDDDDQFIGFIECTFDDARILEVGCGLLHDFMGQGYGYDFISECIDYLTKHYDYSQDTILSYLKHTDSRAIKVMERVGFKVTDESSEWVELTLEL